MAKRTLEYNGYRADEVKSLASWLLKSVHLIPDQKERIYWLDIIKSFTVKDARILIKIIQEVHPTAPNSVLEKVASFVEKRGNERDPYVAMHLIETIGRLPIDLNLINGYKHGIFKYTKEVMKPKTNGENGLVGRDNISKDAMEKIHRTLTNSKGYITPKDASLLFDQAVYVDEVAGDVSPIWDMLRMRPTTIDMKERLSLIYRLTMTSSKKGPLMTVLWGIYSMMKTPEVKEPTTMTMEEIMNETIRTRKRTERLPMPAFAVDVTTIRGRKGTDTTSELSEIKDTSLYHPVTASHGPSPHETIQTSKDSDDLIQRCKAIQRTDPIPEVFETFVWREGESDSLPFEKIERKVKHLRKNPEMVTAIQQAKRESLDETLTIPAKGSGRFMFDFEKMTSYEGPIKSDEALSVLALSRLGRVFAGLLSVPDVQLIVNEKDEKLFLKRSIVCNTPSPKESCNQATTNQEQRSASYPVSKKGVLYSLPLETQTEVIKSFIFRRLVGMQCSPSKCVVQEYTQTVHMPDMSPGKKDYKRCQNIVKQGPFDWLFESSSCSGVIEFVSKKLSTDGECRGEVLGWLRDLMDTKRFELATADFKTFIIPSEAFLGNVNAVYDACFGVPETDEDEEENTITNTDNEEEAIPDTDNEGLSE